MTEFDYIIVGGGAAGCVVAARLAEDPGVTICLLEAGRSDEGDASFSDYRNWTSLVGAADDFYYRVEPQAFGNDRIGISAGRILGGGSSHNTALAFHTPHYDLRQWALLGADGWDSREVRALADAVFNRISGGEHEPRHPIAAAFVDAAMRCGYQQQSLAHWDIGEGVGWLNITSRGGVRQSASVSYLHPLTGLPANLRLRTEVFAEKVVFNDKGRAIGVLAGGETLAARREVVLCAGAIGSAKLLLLSGVGPAQHLRDLGIDVVADSAGVGENLQDHVEGLVMVEASRPFPKPTSHGWEAAVFACSEPDMAAPDIQIHFGTEGYDMNTRELGMPSPEYAVTLAPNVARPASRGTVQLRSPDPTAPPRVDPRYFSDADGHDERVMLAAMRVARRIAATSPLQDWLGLEIAPGSGAQSDQDVLAFLRQAHGSVFHPAGTCRIGAASDPRAVVDPSLRVYGVTALRVADASVFPTLVGVNPCVTSMMVGERAASLIRARSLSISEE